MADKARPLLAEPSGASGYNAAFNTSITFFLLISIKETLLSLALATNNIFPTDGCIEIFEYLKHKNVKVALTTGFYRKVTNIILDKLGWLDGLNDQYVGNKNTIIQASISSDEVLKGRPEPLMIHKAMSLLGVHDGMKVINIGDTPSDLKSGIRAGCRMSLGVTNGTHTRQQLSVHRNDGFLSKVSDLKQFIKNTDHSLVYEKV